MSFGLEVYDADSKRTFTASEDYVRFVEAFNPFTLSIPGSKTYPNLVDLRVVVQQGNSRVLSVSVSGNTVYWGYADAYAWPEYSSAASIRVLTA